MRVRPGDLALIAAGGAVGSLARYGLGEAFPIEPHHFPATTFAINVTGAFLLGVLLEALTRRRTPEHWLRFLLGVGVLGAFTTFSSFMVEIVELARDGHGALAAGYTIASVLAGLVAVLAGLVAAGWRSPPLPAEGES
ncbi:MAG: fluoride efflux transporter CrcB [Acidimicrobiia bacterium]